MPTILEVAQQYEQETGIPVTDYGLGRLGREMAEAYRKWAVDQPLEVVMQAHFTKIEERGVTKVVVCYPEVLRPMLLAGMKLFAERRIAGKENYDREFQNGKRQRKAAEEAAATTAPVKRKRKRIPINQRYVFNLRNSEL